jgi:hemoglobin
MGPIRETIGALRGAAAFTAATLALVLVGALASGACGGTPHHVAVAEVALDGGPAPEASAAAPPPPLYARLGGKEGVAAIVDSFIDDLAADKRLKQPFAKTKGPKLDHFKQMLNDQLCELTGGGCQYTGKIMTDEHAGMKITSAQFDAFVGDFQLALEEKQVAKDDAQQVLDQLALLKDQIVTAK